MGACSSKGAVAVADGPGSSTIKVAAAVDTKAVVAIQAHFRGQQVIPSRQRRRSLCLVAQAERGMAGAEIVVAKEICRGQWIWRQLADLGRVQAVGRTGTECGCTLRPPAPHLVNRHSCPDIDCTRTPINILCRTWTIKRTYMHERIPHRSLRCSSQIIPDLLAWYRFKRCAQCSLTQCTI